MRLINICIGQRDKDFDLIFGDISNEEYLETKETNLARILAGLDVFPSIGEAKKNGFHRDADFGFSEILIKKKFIKIWVFRNRDLPHPISLFPLGDHQAKTVELFQVILP